MNLIITETIVKDEFSCQPKLEYYWIEVKNDVGDTMQTVAALENGLWYVVGCENPEEYQRMVMKKLSHELINPEKSIRDEFEKTWVASGEGEDKLIRDEFGCYEDESAFTAYNWFKIGAGKIEV